MPPSKAVAAREAELTEAREAMGLLKTPFTVCKLFASAAMDFAVENVLAVGTHRLTLVIVYPALALWVISRQVAPGLYDAPDCLGNAGGLLYYPSLMAYEAVWWLLLGILSSIGLGTGLHSGIMFLWPFVMAVITNVEACGSTSFSAQYNHPCGASPAARATQPRVCISSPRAGTSLPLLF